MGRVLLLLLLSGAAWLPGGTIPDLSAYKTTKEKLKALAVACDSLNAIGGAEKVKAISKYALGIVPADDFYNKSLFYFYLGVGYESDVKKDTCISALEASVDYGRKAKSPLRVKNALNRLIYIYANAPGYGSRGDATIRELLGIIDTTRSEAEKASLYGNIGTYYNLKGQYTTEARYLLEAITILKKLIDAGKISDREVVVVDLMNLGLMYYQTGQVEKGLFYTRETRSYITATQYYLAHYYKQMSEGLLLSKKPDQARVYYDSLTAMLKLPRSGIAEFNNRIYIDLSFSQYYLDLDKPDSALLYVGRAARLGEKWADEQSAASIDFMKGKIYYHLKDYEKALPFFTSAEEVIQATDPILNVQILQGLARSYAASGDYRKAFEYYEKYAPLRDTLYKEAAEKSIAEAEAQYQNKEKQQQIDIKNLQIEEGRKEKIWLASGLSMLAVSLCLLAVIYRNKKKNAEILDKKNQELAVVISELEDANQTKAKLFSIISHDLRSPISQVYQFLKLQQLNPKALSEEQRALLSEKIQTATGSLLETMEDLLLWSKTQMSEFRARIQPVAVAPVADQCLKLLQLNIEAKKLAIEKDIPGDAEIYGDPYFLEIILRNLVQNAVKVALPGSTLAICYRVEATEQVLSVTNEGAPFTQDDYLRIISKENASQGLTGLGLKLVGELSEKSGLQIRFSSPSESITTVEIISPASVIAEWS